MIHDKELSVDSSAEDTNEDSSTSSSRSESSGDTGTSSSAIYEELYDNQVPEEYGSDLIDTIEDSDTRIPVNNFTTQPLQSTQLDTGPELPSKEPLEMLKRAGKLFAPFIFCVHIVT